MDLAGKDGKLTSFSVKNVSDEKLAWNTEAKTGVISATGVNQ